jgi:hypothetical protein
MLYVYGISVSDRKNTRCGRAVRGLRSVAAAVLIVLGTASLPASPPETTLEALDRALALLESSDVPVSYVMVTKITIGTPSGETIRTIESADRVTLRPGEHPVRENLYLNDSGEDTDAATGASQTGNSDSSWSFVLPTGGNRALFEFGKTEDKGVTVRSASFEPVRSARRKGGVVKGTLYWDARTLRPLRLEMIPIKNPPFTTKLESSFEFAEQDGFSYPVKARFSGEGGFLFIRRTVTSVSTVTEFLFLDK